MKKKILFIDTSDCGPLVRQKIQAFHKIKEYDVYLLYWHRQYSGNSWPFSIQIHERNIFRINLPEPGGHALRRIMYSFMFWARAWSIVLQIKPHILHCVDMDMWLPACILSFLRHKHKIILELLDTREIYLSRSFKTVIQFFLKRTDLIYITSPRYATDYLGHFGIDPSDRKIVLIPNASPIALYEKFSLKNHKNLTIGYIGTFRGKETIRNLVETVHRINVKKNCVEIFFAGVGPDIPLVKMFAKQYAFVKYSGPYDYALDIKRLYRQVDLIFSMYSMDQNKMIHISNRYHDAVVSRIPIIVQAGTYQAELVSRYKTGYVIELGKWEQLERLLIKLISNPADLKQKADNCKKILRENIFETYVPRLVDSYKGMLENRSVK